MPLRFTSIYQELVFMSGLRRGQLHNFAHGYPAIQPSSVTGLPEFSLPPLTCCATSFTHKVQHKLGSFESSVLFHWQELERSRACVLVCTLYPFPSFLLSPSVYNFGALSEGRLSTLSIPKQGDMNPVHLKAAEATTTQVKEKAIKTQQSHRALHCLSFLINASRSCSSWGYKDPH